jgi:hypothetical protein
MTRCSRSTPGEVGLTEQQAQILMCVTNSSRPLRLIELGSLVSSLRRTGNLKEGKDLVRASCGCLLEILEDETVSVIHHSFTEFLCNESRRKYTDSFPVLESQFAHGMLAVLSLQYLNDCPLLDATSDRPRYENYNDYGDYDEYEFDTVTEMEPQTKLEDMQLMQPLSMYATENLVYHIEHADAKDENVLDALTTFLAPGKPALFNWMCRHWDSRLCSSFTSVHLANFTGMPLHVIQHLAPSGADTRDVCGRTPLSYAAERGSTRTAKFFLDYGGDPKSQDQSGYTPLYYSASGGLSRELATWHCSDLAATLWRTYSG